MQRRPEKRDNPDNEDKASAADSEAEAFARAMADVARLPPDPRGECWSAAPHERARAAAPLTSSSARHDVDEGSEAGFVAPGVDRRELRRLKRGAHVPGGRLDLHGQTAAEAIASVKRFIDNGRHRCVCIVHGRGLHSEGNVSILKTRVRACLRQQRAVLAYADAPRADGGTGAVYVLLRK